MTRGMGFITYLSMTVDGGRVRQTILTPNLQDDIFVVPRRVFRRHCSLSAIGSVSGGRHGETAAEEGVLCLNDNSAPTRSATMRLD